MSYAILDVPCALSPYAVHKGGYVYVTRLGQSWLHHRWVYAQHHGLTREDLDGWAILHKCDNPRCIEPTHLLKGTWSDNNKDRAAKGRSAVRNVARRVLSVDQRTEIQRRYVKGRPGVRNPNGVSALSREFGVDTNIIYKVIKGGYV